VTVDYAHTSRAEQNRLEKAQALAAVAGRLGVDANGLAVGTGNRRRVWKDAGLKRAPSEDTWFAVVDLLGVPAAVAPRQSPPTGCCLYHPDRPGRFYLCGYRCAECSPAAKAGRVVPAPPPGTTAERRPAPGMSVDDVEPWVREIKRRRTSAIDRAALATRVYLRGLSNPGPAP
jgi:hypothetical protein